MFSTLLMGGGGHTREKDHQNVKSLIIFAHDCSYRVVANKGSSPSNNLQREADQTVTSILFIQSVDRILVRAFQ